MDTRQQTGERKAAERWPALPYPAWKETYETLHMWTQIVGKVRMELSPLYIKLRTSPLDTGPEQGYTCSRQLLNAEGESLCSPPGSTD